MPHKPHLAFEREVLKRVHAEVRTHSPGICVSASWVYKCGRDLWEFHGPDTYYWSGRAGSAWEARAKGWTAWMAHREDRGEA